jgi:hypothetical protein
MSTSSQSTTPLKEIISNDGDSIGYTFFYYDTLNRLVSIIDSNNNSTTPIANISIHYDVQGRPVSYTSLSIEGLDDSSIFIYDNNGMIIKQTYMPINTQSGNPPMTHTYTYDGEGRLVADDGSTVFTYNSDGNISEWESYLFDPISDTTQAFYDTHINPYVSMGKFLYFITGNNSLLNRNNIVKMILPDKSTIGYTYTYNSNGLPENVTLSYSAYPNLGNNHIQFIYE